MSNLNENVRLMNSLSQTLVNNISKIESGELSITKAKVINSTAREAIKANIAVTIQHQKIQVEKTKIRVAELDFKKEELKYKEKRFLT